MRRIYKCNVSEYDEMDLPRLSELRDQYMQNPASLLAVEKQDADYLTEKFTSFLRDYANEKGFKGYVIGLSGGIDSSVSAALAVKAVGKENVYGMLLPSKFTSQQHIDDALMLAEQLGISTNDYSVVQANFDKAIELTMEMTGVKEDDKKHNLGQTPIPGGELKVYRNIGKAGNLSYTGQSSFKYIPVDEDVELNLGAVSDVVVEPKLMDFATDNYMFDSRGNISGWDEIRIFSIEVRNTRDIPVKVEIQRNFDTVYWSLEKSGDFGDYENIDKDTVKFTLTIGPRSTQKFGYTLTTRHGTRAN